MDKRGLFAGILGFLTVFSLQIAFSAPPPDAGSLLRQQKLPPTPTPGTLPKGEKPSLYPSDKEKGVVRVKVKGFLFQGIEGMATEAELTELLSEAIDKELGFAELQQLAARVTSFLQEKGYFLARAYLPEQDISTGTIVIVVVAGRLEGEVLIRKEESARIRTEILQEMARTSIDKGNALKTTRLERSLLLMNDLPGISAQATMEKGETPGSTKMIIDAQEGPLLNSYLNVDNSGNRYTGTIQSTAALSINDPLGIGDQLSMAVVGAEDFFQGQVNYSGQILPNGLKGNLNYSGLYYRLGKEFEDLESDGRADTLGASLAYPLVRRRSYSFWSTLLYEYRMLDDYALGVQTKERTINTGSIELSCNVYDQMGGGGLTNLQISLKTGDVALGVEIDAITDAATAGAEGAYAAFTYSGSRLQRLSGDFTAYVSATGQLTGENLDSSEKFILGGPYGIRSYPVGEAVGDEGHSFTAELRYDLHQLYTWGQFQLIAFIDSGTITLHEDPWQYSIHTATGENSYWLTGAGMGVNVSKSDTYALRLSIAHTIGDNPGRTPDGNNADNKDDEYRFWLQATYWF